MHIRVLIFLLLPATIGIHELSAQEVVGLSFGYQHFPSAALVQPLEDAPGLEIESNTWNVSGAFPLSFQDGKIIVLNKINYRYTSFSYKRFPADGIEIEQVQSVDFSVFLIDSLSAKWKLAIMVNPMLASAFESKLSKDDFIMGAVLGMIRSFKPNLDLGFGLTYISIYGNPVPLPFIYVDWQPKPKWSINGIIPSNLRISRQMTNWLDLGLEFFVDGNRYHGSPEKFDTPRPFMRYSEGTLNGIARIHFTEWLHLHLRGGWGFYRNFEFYDGRQKEVSFDMKKVPYLGTQVVIGI